MLPFINELEVTISQSTWIPVYISGDDLPGSMSLSKIAKYLILPLADSKISILALSMYQCDYVLVRARNHLSSLFIFILIIKDTRERL